jgi:hypothetical protein
MVGSSISAGLPPHGSMEAASFGGRGGASPLLRLLVAAALVAPPIEGVGPQPPLLRCTGAAARGGEEVPPPGAPPPAWGKMGEEGGENGRGTSGRWGKERGEVKEDDTWGPRLGSWYGV